MQHTKAILGALASFALLAGCEGLTALQGQLSDEVTTTYRTLDDTEAGTSTLGGVAVVVKESNISWVETAGTLNHNTRDVEATIGQYTLKNDDLDIWRYDPQDTNKLYEYVALYTPSDSWNEENSEGTFVGVGGIMTDPAHVPTSGKAVYTGGSVVGVNYTDGDTNGYVGDSTITADFAASKVDVRLDNFKDAESNATSTIVVTANDMSISGNRFLGGNTYITEDGQDMLGALSSSRTEGAFFGYDASNSAPDEVGGIVLLESEKGVASGYFLAD